VNVGYNGLVAHKKHKESGAHGAHKSNRIVAPDPVRAQQIFEQLRVEPGQKAALHRRDPAWTAGPDFEGLTSHELKKEARAILESGITELVEAQEMLWADDTYAVLVVFQALDAAGKDSTIKHVMTGVNPQGVHVVSFKQPSSEELDHDYLWRIGKALPARGTIGIFNRSHYEEVVALRVHPDWLDAQRLPPHDNGPEFWATRFDDINGFERHLDRNGVKIVKFFLNVSKAEQKRRFIARLDTPGKEWKFSAADVAERRHWDAYQAAFEEAITATSTPWAPWFVVPADHKPIMQAIVVRILVESIRALGLEYPKVSPAQRKKNREARRQLEDEAD
jgi:PPK2 family polyphosphate:nucleotide phosphotransferase